MTRHPVPPLAHRDARAASATAAFDAPSTLDHDRRAHELQAHELQAHELQAQEPHAQALQTHEPQALGSHDLGTQELRALVRQRAAHLTGDGQPGGGQPGDERPDDEPRLRATLAEAFAPVHLEVREITAAAPPALREWLMRHEGVHPMGDDAELQQRLGPADRLTYGLFHPALPVEPVAFTSIALVTRPVDAIDDVLAPDRGPGDRTAPAEATMAVFYSISTCHAGLRGLGLGRTMLTGALARAREELPALRDTVTLSPAPALRAWLEHTAAAQGDASPPGLVRRALAAGEHPPGTLLRDAVERFVADATRPGETPRDPVARFHLGNGARLDRVLPGADPSPVALAQSFGLMVSYRYDGQAPR